MPHDLFGDVAVRRASRTMLRRFLTIFSVALHAVVIASVVVAQLFASGPLPVPHRPLVFEELRLVKLIDIKLPSPPRPAPTGPAHTVSPSAAPLVQPTGIIDETGLESVRTTATSEPVIGVERGIVGVDSLGTVERAAPPPPLPPPPPVRLHAGIQAPKKIVDVAPVYPPLAQAARREGIVILEAIIDARGLVKSVSVLRSIQLLDQAAVEAVRQWRFTPALLNGEAIPVVMTVTVNFKLDR